MCSMVFLPNMYSTALSRPEPCIMYPMAPIKFIRVWNPPNLTTIFKYSVTTMSTVLLYGWLLVGWLEFNVPFQHKYGYIRDEALLYSILYCTAESNVTPVVSKFSTCACLLTKANIDLTQVTSDEFRSLFNGWQPLKTLCMYPVHKGLRPLPMSGTPAACHSVFKLVITGAVISVSRLLRGFMAYFSGLAPVCWQNWTPGTLFLKQASLSTSCALNLGKLGFWSAAMPEFPDQLVS